MKNKMIKNKSKITLEMNKISALIIAKNEEKKITDCLKSLTWVDEIILIDNGSVDKTIDIANEYNAKVVLMPGAGYSELRNKGKTAASNKWILYVDADERVTEELRDEIISKLRIADTDFSAYAIPRRNKVLGREMKHGGWWPDYVKRLFEKDKLKKWIGDLHEEPLYDGIMGHLENPLVHIKEDNLSDMIVKTNIRSEIEAKLMFDSEHPKMNLVRFISAILREFWYRIVKNKAYLDGTEGMIFGIYQIYSRFISYAKLWEMQNISQKPKVGSKN